MSCHHIKSLRSAVAKARKITASTIVQANSYYIYFQQSLYKIHRNWTFRLSTKRRQFIGLLIDNYVENHAIHNFKIPLFGATEIIL